MSDISKEELDELRRLADIGRHMERIRANEAKAREELAADAKQTVVERSIARQVVDWLNASSAAKQAADTAKQPEDDARVAEAVFKRLKAEEKRQGQKAKDSFGKAVGVALVGALVGFYGSLVKAAIEDDKDGT